MTKLINPAPGGWRGRGWIPGTHRGTDFGFYNADPDGSQRVVAAAAGTVISESVGGGYNNGWGNQYIIDHGHGIYTTYNHFRTGSMQVDVGQRVEAGTWLGQMGETGNVDGVHLHFEVRIGGWGGDNRVDPGPWLDGVKEIPGGGGSGAGGALAPNQRRVLGDGAANRRIGAPSTSAPLGEPLQPGDVGNFTGWVRGENVSGNDVWFIGVSGDYFWSGAFEGGANTSGLEDKNQAKPSDPTQRVATDEVRGRAEPTTKSAVVGENLMPGDVGNFVGWTEGENIDGENRWLKGTSGRWFTLKYLSPQNVDGLPKIDTGTPTDPPANSGGTLDPNAPWKKQSPDSPLAKWVGSPNYNYRPAAPKEWITLHWMAGTLASTDAHFQDPGDEIKDGRGTGTSTQYGIGLTEIHQYVKENQYAHGDGNAESNAKGISIEHEGGYKVNGKVVSVGQSTLDLSAQLCADIARRHGWKKLEWMVNIFPHKHWVATECPGTLDTDYIVKKANILLGATTTPPEGPKPITVERAKLVSIRDAINELLG